MTCAFWSMINTLTPQQSYSNVPDVVEVGTIKIPDSKEIAEKFNEQ